MSEDAARPLPAGQLLAVPTTGPLAAAPVTSVRAANRGRPAAADGTPEQIHLTWGNDPARSVVVSWASPGQAEAPRVRIGQRVIPAIERGYAGGPSGEVSWTYHALVDGLRPGGTYGYAVTADNDRNAADPFSATFRTAPQGRAAFRFTSFGDLATPNARWASSSGQSAYAVGAVETFQPLFHLLNGDLADGDPAPAAQSRVWRDFGNNIQASAANRPWMPVPGDHGVEYLARYSLPDNGLPEFAGRWYDFRIGTVAFICLSGDDVADADARASATDVARWRPAAATGNAPAARHLAAHARLLGRRADPLARGDPRRRARRLLDRLDRRRIPPVRVLLLAGRPRVRPRHQAGMAAAVRPVRGRPGALRARPRLRAVVPHPRHRFRRHAAPAPGDHHRQRGVRHQPGHRPPGTRLRRRGRQGRGRSGRRGTLAMRRRSRRGPRGATPPPGTASRSSTSTPAPRPAGRRRSPSGTTTRSTPTRPRARRPTTTRSSRRSPWSGRDPTDAAGTRKSHRRQSARRLGVMPGSGGESRTFRLVSRRQQWSLVGEVTDRSSSLLFGFEFLWVSVETDLPARILGGAPCTMAAVAVAVLPAAVIRRRAGMPLAGTRGGGHSGGGHGSSGAGGFDPSGQRAPYRDSMDPLGPMSMPKIVGRVADRAGRGQQGPGTSRRGFLCCRFSRSSSRSGSCSSSAGTDCQRTRSRWPRSRLVPSISWLLLTLWWLVLVSSG